MRPTRLSDEMKGEHWSRFFLTGFTRFSELVSNPVNPVNPVKSFEEHYHAAFLISCESCQIDRADRRSSHTPPSASKVETFTAGASGRPASGITTVCSTSSRTLTALACRSSAPSPPTGPGSAISSPACTICPSSCRENTWRGGILPMGQPDARRHHAHVAHQPSHLATQPNSPGPVMATATGPQPDRKDGACFKWKTVD